MACVRNKSLVSAECIGEDLSANNREYMVLGGSEGRKIISNKNEPKQFKNGKQRQDGVENRDKAYSSNSFSGICLDGNC